MANSVSRGPISKKVLAALNREMKRKVIDFGALKMGAERAEELERGIIREEGMAGMDPVHAVYVYAQNKMSVMVEQIMDLPICAELADAYSDAQEEYVPFGPPESPLTRSYFCCWSTLDSCVGKKRETLATVAIDMCRMLRVDPNLIRLFEHMQNSRMGVYMHEGVTGQRVMLKEFVTGKRHECVSPAGHMGELGEVWYVRIMPDPFEKAQMGYDVVFTTPYVLLTKRDGRFDPVNQDDWQAYFERTLPKTGIQDASEAYCRLMKYGLSPNYWNEFVFEGYVNHKHEMIWLAGFPDDEASRPHSRVNLRDWMGMDASHRGGDNHG